MREKTTESEHYIIGCSDCMPDDEDVAFIASLRNALPQIVAVVEAAEQARVCSIGCEKCREEELAPVLTTLEEALS